MNPKKELLWGLWVMVAVMARSMVIQCYFGAALTTAPKKHISKN